VVHCSKGPKAEHGKTTIAQAIAALVGWGPPGSSPRRGWSACPELVLTRAPRRRLVDVTGTLSHIFLETRHEGSSLRNRR